MLSTFQLAGRNCTLRTDSEELRKILNAVAADARMRVDGFELNVEVDTTIRRHSPGAAHFRGLNHIVFAIFENEVFVFDLKRRRVDAAVSLETSEDKQFWMRTLLPIALGTLGLAIGVIPLHCACLDWNGSAMLITGPSGAGKSTLTFALARNGAHLVSDDWTYFCGDDRKLVAHGVDAPVKLMPDTIRFFPELASVETQTSLNGELAYEIAGDVGLTLTRKSCAVPGAVLLLRRVPTNGVQIRPCAGTTIRDYFERSGERVPPEMSHLGVTRSHLIDKIAAMPCFTVESGQCPQSTAEALGQWWKEQEWSRC